MNKILTKSISILTTCLLISTFLIGCSTNDFSEVVAEVNGIKITRAEFNLRKAIVLSEFENKNEVTDGYVLKILVVNKLLGEEARRNFGAGIGDIGFEEYLNTMDFNIELSQEKIDLMSSLGYDNYTDFYMNSDNLTFIRNEVDALRLRDLIFFDIEREHSKLLHERNEITFDDFEEFLQNVAIQAREELDNLAMRLKGSANIMIYPRHIRTNDFYLHENDFRLPDLENYEVILEKITTEKIQELKIN